MTQTGRSKVPRDRRLLTLTLVAASVRTLWLFAPPATFGDALEYQRIAASLAARHLFSIDGRVASSYRPPLYPAVIAALDLLTGHPIAMLLAVQIVLSTLTVVLVVRIAEDTFGGTAAWTAGLLLALAPMTARFSTLMLTETVFTVLVVAATWAWKRSRPIAAGVAFGLAILTRASTLPFMFALALYGLVGRRRSPREALTLALVALLVVAPWAVRNLVQVGRFTVADAGWGSNLFYGSVDLRRGANRWTQLAEAQERAKAASATTPQAEDAPAMEKSAESRVAAIALARIAAHPVSWIGVRARQWPWLLVDTGDYLPVSANTVSFSNAVATRRLSTIALKLGFLGGNLLVLLVAAVGVWSCRGRRLELLPLWTFPAYLMAAHLPVYVEPRYGLPIVPFVAIFAGAGVRSMLLYWRPHDA